MKRKYYLVLLLGAFLISGCKKEQETEGVSAVKVITEKVKYSLANGQQGFSGTVEEENSSSLSFATGGTVREIYVSQGQMVKRGELLAAVDDVTLQNLYASAFAMRCQAEDACARMKQLHDSGSLPEIQWVEAQSKTKQAVAAEHIARKSLSDAKMYAPYDGYISDKTVDVGQNVMPGMSVLKIVKVDRVKVKIYVPENEIAKIKKGEAVSIRVPALGGKSFVGSVSEKGVVANPLSRSYEVSVIVANTAHALLPGMICDAFLGKRDGVSMVMMIPASAVSIDADNGKFVWINNGGKATRRRISIGNQAAEGVSVESGLRAGDEVIVEGQQKVSEGIRIVTAE